MKKLLYISVNTKPEHLSTSKTVARKFIESYMAENPDFEVEELDLYKDYIPELNYKMFKTRAETVTGAEYDALSSEDKKGVDRINELCDQFLSADTYVIAAPMWSISFPARLKSYVDCVIINNKTIKVEPENVEGLLGDKERQMIYIQSSGGVYPKIMDWKLNHGVNYFHDSFKFLGVEKFEKILVEGVDMPSVGKEKAMEKAYEDIDKVIDKLSKKPLFT
ncbi:FMN-dependent NADH-azoreductase [Clostridium oceanicum]|uniref:FMN dependent NADH:quinone oxidoreductase n=1 Tax=Clostridium oceanicum TaxID=1543 RepID=A0ABP3USY5_9CLOT